MEEFDDPGHAWADDPDYDIPQYLREYGKISPELKWLIDEDGCSWPNPYYGNPYA